MQKISGHDPIFPTTRTYTLAGTDLRGSPGENRIVAGALMKVLVVDQEAFLAELVKLALEADGHDCFTAASVDEASEIMRSIRFDLIALDLATDDPNALGWLEETTLGHPELEGRAFVLAGRSLEQAEAARIRECGARVIQKPFTLHQLRDTVRMMTPLGGMRSDGRSRGSVIET